MFCDSGEHEDTTGEELTRCEVEMELARRRREHFRKLIRKFPDELTALVREGLSVNEIFKRLPLEPGKPMPADLWDENEASRSASGARSRSSTPFKAGKSEPVDEEVVDVSSEEDAEGSSSDEEEQDEEDAAGR